MAISRSWTWDDNKKRSEEELDHIEPTLDALAAKWSDIQSEIENEGFRRQARYEYGDDGPELPECEHCDSGYVGYDRRRKFFCATGHHWGDPGDTLVFPVCPACGGTGIDQKEVKRMDVARRAKDARRQVELEVVEEMLARYGARMMRPYEHWNEDEAYMAYQERDRG